MRRRLNCGIVGVMALVKHPTGWARVPGFGGIGRAVSNRNYRIYAAGNVLSVIGGWVQRVAVVWLAWQLSESPAWLGAIAFADLLPSILVAPFAGYIADRRNRLHLLMMAQAAAMTQAVILCVLTALDRMTIEVLMALTLFLGTVIGFSQPVRLSLVPSLVRPQDLSAAIAVNSLVFNSARFVGPAIAGVVIVKAGVAWAFGLNALSFLGLLAALARLRLPPQERGATKGLGVIAGLLEGLTYASRHPGIGPLLVLLGVSAFFGRPVMELLAAFAGDVFDRGADGLAMLTAANGFGAMAAGFWLSQRGPVRGLTRAAVVSVLVFGVAIALFGITELFAAALVCIGVAGFAMVVGAVGIQTLLQFSVDSTMRGRVLSLYGLTFRGGIAIGALAMGTAADHFGLALPVIVGGTMCATAWLFAVRRIHVYAAALED